MSILDELNLAGRRRLPVVLSAEAAECGLVCMTMIGRYWGHDLDLNGLRQRFSVSMSGMSMRGLVGLADQMGFSTRALKVEMFALSQIQLPAILHWDLNHFVVLKSVGPKDAVIHDPGAGARRISLDEVSRRFTGIVLEVRPAPAFKPIVAKTPVRLSHLYSRLVGVGPALIQVVALSAALQVVAFLLPFQIQLVVDEGVLRGDRDLLTVLGLAFGGLVIVQGLIALMRDWSLQAFGHMMSFQMIGNLVRHLMRLPVDYFEKRHVGDVLSRIQSAATIQDVLTRGVVAVILDGVMALVAGVILFVYSAKLASVVLVAVLLHLGLSLALYPLMRKRQEEKIFESAREQSHLMETVRAATTVKVMGREAEREGVWRNYYARVINASFAVGKYEIYLANVQAILTGLQSVLVIYFGARLILDGDGFSVGMLFAFLSFRQTFSDRAGALVDQVVKFRLLGLHMERLGDIVSAEPDAIDEVTGPVEKVEGGIEMRGVDFRYGASDPLTLQNIDLAIRPGEFVAITGPSGGGKTTLLKVLLGLHRPAAGVVKLDGQEAGQAHWRAWREQVGVVAQDDRLLSGSLAENIAFFDPDLDMARVEEAARRACIHDDIVAMPMRYLSLVGDMGSTLSGGQKQRVLLARALYRRPRILFLDEGTANLDVATEERIAELLADMDITRIVVAHRPALIRHADRVVVIERGRVRAEADMKAEAEMAAAE